MATEAPIVESRPFSFRSLVAGLLSIALLAIFSISHATRSDTMMLPTIFPVTLWLFTGLCVTLFINRLRWLQIALIVGWLASAFFLGDAPQNILWSFQSKDSNWESARASGKAIRVVSLNCLSNPNAIEELLAFEPDVILTQESPSSSHYRELSESQFKDFTLVWSPDAAMLVRGTATIYPVPRALTSHYVLAEVELKNGAKFKIGSLRLRPCPLRFDVWNRSAWQELTQNRVRRRQQLTDIFAQIQPQLVGSPLILGGDFNAPARDAIFEILKPGLRDAWPEAGRGWGKTIINKLPVQRIDQVWITSHFRAQSVTAHQNGFSDHRSVICDLWLDN